MNLIDFILIIIVAAYALNGLMAGAGIGLYRIIMLVLAVFIYTHGVDLIIPHVPASSFLEKTLGLDINEDILHLLLSFIFIMTMFLIGNLLLAIVVKNTRPSGMSKFLGVFVGIFRACLLVVIAVLFSAHFDTERQKNVWQNSLTLKYFGQAAEVVTKLPSISAKSDSVLSRINFEEDTYQPLI